MSMGPNYSLIAKRATPIKADCYDCDLKWSGPLSRSEAMAHSETVRHAVWIECAPHPEDAAA
jgi:hypothetical protein